ERLLAGLRLARDAEVSTLSAGLSRRVLLARALASDPDLLLLDEPTNHLDLPSIRWLEEHLIERAGATLFVTHDRAFLRRVATRTDRLRPQDARRGGAVGPARRRGDGARRGTRLEAGRTRARPRRRARRPHRARRTERQRQDHAPAHAPRRAPAARGQRPARLEPPDDLVRPAQLAARPRPQRVRERRRRRRPDRRRRPPPSRLRLPRR